MSTIRKKISKNEPKTVDIVKNFYSVKRPIKTVEVTQSPKIEPPMFNMTLQGVSKDGNNKLHN